MKKRLLALALLLALVIGAMPAVQAAGSLFFVSVNNDIPVLLSGDTTPFYSNGLLYAPYTVFSASPGGINVSYNVDQETFTLFTLSNTVVYNLAEGVMTDRNGSSTTADVIYRNGVLYLPVVRAAEQFGLSVSLINSKSGCAVLRFKDGTEVYDDQTFLEKSELFISHMLDTYGNQGLGGEVVSETEPEPEEEEPPVDSAETYLIFAGDAVNQRTMGHLEALEYVSEIEVYATFFLTQSQIRENPQLVRDIYNGGHQIGLTVEQDETDVETALRRANDALDETVFFRSVMALLPDEVPAPDSFRVVRSSQTVQTVEAMLEQAPSQTVFLCKGDVATVLEQLTLHNVTILQLLETTIPEQVSVEAE